MTNKKQVQPKLTDKQLAFVTYVEQAYWETGYIPTVEKLADILKMSRDQVKQMQKNQVVIASCVARGIDLSPEDANRVLTPQQLLCANMVLNTVDKRSLRQKLETIGVSV